MTNLLDKSQPSANKSNPRVMSKWFLRTVAWFGIVITGLSSLLLIAFTGTYPPLDMVVAVVLTDVIVLILVKLERPGVAIRIFAIAAFSILIRQSFSSYDAFLLATSGFVALVLTVLVILPGRQWVIAMVTAQLFMLGANVWFVRNAETALLQAHRFDTAIWQTTVFIVSSGAIGIAYESIMRAKRQSEAAIDALRRNEQIAQQRSAELEASYTALANSESRYRTLIEGANEAILLCAYPSWSIIGANAAACNLFQYPLDELLELKGPDLSAGPPFTTFGDEFRPESFSVTIEQRELLAFEQLHKDKHGHEFMCHVRMIMLPGDSSQIRVTIADVDEQRAIEKRERDLTERLHLVSNNIPVRIAYLDAALNVQFWNKSFAQVFSLADKEPPLAAGDVFGDSLTEEYQPYFVDTFAGKRTEFESIGMSEDGLLRTGRVTFIPHEVDGVVVGIFAAAVDISAEREAQYRLAETSEFLQLITDNIPARLSYTAADGTLRFLNKEYESYGVVREKALGKLSATHLPAEVNTDIESIKETVMAGERAVLERRVKTGADSERIESIVAVPHIVDDVVQGFILLASDITEWRKAEESFQQAQKVESLGILAGGIAHDFNNLLVAILGQNTLAQAKLAEGHPAEKHVAKAIQASQRAASLTNQMLAYSGRGAFAIEPIYLNNLIKENLGLFRLSAPQIIQFTTDYAAELPLFDGDAAQMQQVIMNLIINAGQAIGDQPGCIKVSTSTITLAQEDTDTIPLVDGTLSSGSYVVVAIEDDGAGMDQETLKRIFDPFFSTKEDGSGLGLAAVLGIVRGHSGAIACQSEVGCGTIFRLYFPTSSLDQTNGHCASETIPPAPANLRTVLVIDDNPSVSGVVVDILEMEGIRTIEHNDPLVGIDYFRQHAQSIDLVILDVMMPKMNGTKVLQKLREIDPYVYVLLSSGYSHEDIVSRFLDSGTDFIQKPYDYRQLVRQVYAAFVGEETRVPS